MEVARSQPFLDSMIMFSLILSPNYEKNFKTEIWLCHKNMNLSMEDIYNMTIIDRKNFIAIHNKEVEKDNERLKNMTKH